MQVGFVGTGTMGNPMVRCLLEAGHVLTVYDVRREATANLCELGAHWADTPRAVAEASAVVLTSLPGPTEVEQGVLDPATGVLAGLRPGGAYIDMTTNTPRVVRWIAEVCRARGVDVLKRAQVQGWGQQGYPIVARILEAMAGVELRAPAARDTEGYQTQDPRRG